MEEELISKKDLLELKDISYGQLYRWKRKSLIPEDWFIRKSTFTGQETFFPKERILARIDKIINMKEDLSLDELADLFSPAPAVTELSKGVLIERNIVSRTALELYVQQCGDAEVFAFEQLLFLYILDQMLQGGEMSLEEGKTLLRILADDYRKFQGKNCELIFVRKMGVSMFCLVANPSDIYFEAGVKVLVRLNLATSMEELKTKLS
ncbi:MAG: YhbD family protein [Tumebacillaceae bacterium]